MRRVMLVAVVVCLWSHVVVAEIQESGVKESPPAASSSLNWGDVGYGSLAVLTNIFYMPAKIVYGTLGLVTGSLAYLLTVGDGDAAMTIWNPSLGGTYVVTPAMLSSDEPILFSGPSHSKN